MVADTGTIHLQKPKEIRDPVIDAAKKPATDFRRAKGSGMVEDPAMGSVRDCGKGEVR